MNTRWCTSDWSGWRYASYGLRVIDPILEPLGPDSDVDTGIAERRLQLRDFNSYAFSTPISEDDASLEAWRKGRIVTESSWIPAGTIFIDAVESGLPYQEVITKERFNVTSVMMDEDKIVLLKVLLSFFSSWVVNVFISSGMNVV